MLDDLHIRFARVDYRCPYCDKYNDDLDEKLLSKCNKNKSTWTKVKCDCGKRFGFTYNYKGDAVAFKIFQK